MVASGDGLIELADWSVFGVLSAYADILRETLTMEKSGSAEIHSNSTMSLEIHDNSTEFQLNTFLLGIAGCIVKFSYFYMEIYIHGLNLFVAVTMNQFAEKFIKLLKGSRCNGRKIIHTYEFFYRSTAQLNETLGWIVALFSIQTFFSFVYIMNILIGKELPIWLKALILLQNAVGTTSYYYGVCIPAKARFCIHSWYS